MPCRDWESESYSRESERSAANTAAAMAEERVKAELVPKLCAACTILEANNLLPEELVSWWEPHKRQDAMRRAKAAEKLMEAVRQKKAEEHLKSVRARLEEQLTDDEKQAMRLYPHV